jgi:lactocepin
VERTNKGIKEALHSYSLGCSGFWEDTAIPNISIQSPAPLGIYNTSKLPFIGTVSDESGVQSLTIDGQSVPLTETSATQASFNTTLSYKDGFYGVPITAVDKSGNEISIQRKFFVDTTAPTLTTTTIPTKVGKNKDSVTINVSILDNFDDIRFYVNGSEEFGQSLKEPYVMRSFNKVLNNVKLQLEPGENNFVLEVVDLGGNKTTKEFTIVRDSK